MKRPKGPPPGWKPQSNGLIGPPGLSKDEMYLEKGAELEQHGLSEKGLKDIAYFARKAVQGRQLVEQKRRVEQEKAAQKEESAAAARARGSTAAAEGLRKQPSAKEKAPEDSAPASGGLESFLFNRICADALRPAAPPPKSRVESEPASGYEAMLYNRSCWRKEGPLKVEQVATTDPEAENARRRRRDHVKRSKMAGMEPPELEDDLPPDNWSELFCQRDDPDLAELLEDTESRPDESSREAVEQTIGKEKAVAEAFWAQRKAARERRRTGVWPEKPKTEEKPALKPEPIQPPSKERAREERRERQQEQEKLRQQESKDVEQPAFTFDLSSPVVDLAIDWQAEGLLSSFSLRGWTAVGLEAWAPQVIERGGLMLEDFGNEGVELDLSGATSVLGDTAQLAALAKALTADTSLTRLRLPAGEIGDKGAAVLADALTGNVALTELMLSNNSIGDDGTIALAAALERGTELRSVQLDGNRVGDAGAVRLARALGRSPSLLELNLSGNGIGDLGASALAEALEDERLLCSVEVLTLEGNPVGEHGIARLKEAFEESAALVELRVADVRLAQGAGRPPGSKQPEDSELFILTSSSEEGISIAGGQQEPDAASGKDAHLEASLAWQQQDNLVTIEIRGPFLQESEQRLVDANFASQSVKVEYGGMELLDLELFAEVVSGDCSWSLEDGVIKVTLPKRDPASWPRLGDEA
eukprot:gnl/TRDRNA2_/TRDRNA2_36936_c0_seq1.p1 gnl/TRDRNA2_/TRDRNA2_36936_c0~~gnl/TRDRNA2_/TRDRNA2_36936_c0_seq1.p1  ORF type:complete len:715 (-),score=203.57 gnl/TRDRNA2_/TRDRNA2_36936_c0_seq1:51-2159(-)